MTCLSDDDIPALRKGNSTSHQWSSPRSDAEFQNLSCQGCVFGEWKGRDERERRKSLLKIRVYKGQSVALCCCQWSRSIWLFFSRHPRARCSHGPLAIIHPPSAAVVIFHIPINPASTGSLETAESAEQPSAFKVITKQVETAGSMLLEIKLARRLQICTAKWEKFLCGLQLRSIATEQRVHRGQCLFHIHVPLPSHGSTSTACGDTFTRSQLQVFHAFLGYTQDTQSRKAGMISDTESTVWFTASTPPANVSLTSFQSSLQLWFHDNARNSAPQTPPENKWN